MQKYSVIIWIVVYCDLAVIVSCFEGWSSPINSETLSTDELDSEPSRLTRQNEDSIIFPEDFPKRESLDIRKRGQWNENWNSDGRTNTDNQNRRQFQSRDWETNVGRRNPSTPNRRISSSFGRNEGRRRDDSSITFEREYSRTTTSQDRQRPHQDELRKTNQRLNNGGSGKGRQVEGVVNTGTVPYTDLIKWIRTYNRNV